MRCVADLTLGEDLRQARTGSGRQVLVTPRNLLISVLRSAGLPASPEPYAAASAIPTSRTLVTCTNATLQ